MPKVEREARVELRKIDEKGRAWLAKYEIFEGEFIVMREFSAWSNPSAAKRWVKTILLATTPRKSMPFLAGNHNDKGKPMLFTGSVRFKVDA